MRQLLLICVWILLKEWSIYLPNDLFTVTWPLGIACKHLIQPLKLLQVWEFGGIMHYCVTKYYNYLCRVDENLCVKVADFGLAKDIYSSEYYRMNSNTKVPVKWMAPESLLDGFFNEKTDVVCDIYIDNTLKYIWKVVCI